MAETLASISEYGEDSRATSITGLSSSSYTITRSQSSDSLNTMSTTGRNYNNGLHRERKKSEISHRLRAKSLTPKRNYEFCKKVRVTMALIGILLLVAAIFMLSFYLPKQYKTNTDSETVIQPKNKRLIWDDNIEIKEDMIILFSTNFSGPVLESEVGPDIALKAYFGELLTYNVSRKQVSKVITNDSISIRFLGVNLDTELKISKLGFHDQCYQIHWVAKHDTTKLQDCFDTEASKWFGLGEIFNQVWPINKASFKMTPFLTSDFLVTKGFDKVVLGGVLEPFIINSKGAGIYVSDTVPLYIGMNENEERKFCIRAEKRRCDVDNVNENSTNELNYTICVANNVKEVHKIMFNQYIEKPIGIPDERMLTEPIWSTWVQFKKNVNQSVILKFAENIKKHNFQASHIVIDDKYSTEYGDFNFDPKKFDDVSNMINLLRSDGFRTIVWIPPFANLESKFFRNGLDYWVKVGSQDHRVPGIVNWWNGLGGVIDTTNEKSKKWFVGRLNEFKKLKIDGFKFDAGEALNSLPMFYRFTVAQPNPNYFSKYYVKLASKFTLSEVRVGYKSQKYPIFVRLIDRRSGWDAQNGLRSVLSAALSLSIIGYPFILPDMVGGNAYYHHPSKELFIRWTQLCTFLPAIQFSIPPWYYNNEVITIVHEAMSIRQNLSNYILKLAKDVVKSGEPIIRPLWWYWPNDQETFVLDSEFMLGEQYLIAPVLSPNIIQHAVYLPAGIWQEQWGKKEILNMTAGDYKHYTVTLHVICYFKLIRILPG